MTDALGERAGRTSLDGRTSEAGAVAPAGARVRGRR